MKEYCSIDLGEGWEIGLDRLDPGIDVILSVGDTCGKTDCILYGDSDYVCENFSAVAIDRDQILRLIEGLTEVARDLDAESKDK